MRTTQMARRTPPQVPRPDRRRHSGSTRRRAAAPPPRPVVPRCLVGGTGTGNRQGTSRRQPLARRPGTAAQPWCPPWPSRRQRPRRPRRRRGPLPPPHARVRTGVSPRQGCEGAATARCGLLRTRLNGPAAIAMVTSGAPWVGRWTRRAGGRMGVELDAAGRRRQRTPKVRSPRGCA